MKAKLLIVLMSAANLLALTRAVVQKVTNRFEFMEINFVFVCFDYFFPSPQVTLICVAIITITRSSHVRLTFNSLSLLFVFLFFFFFNPLVYLAVCALVLLLTRICFINGSLN